MPSSDFILLLISCAISNPSPLRELLPVTSSQHSGDSMEPEFHDGQIAWVLQQESVANGEIGIFALNGEAYIKKLQVLFIGHIILHN